MAATMRTDDETSLLLNLWGDETVQALLECCMRNHHVYERIAGDLEEAAGGYRRTGNQCRDILKS